MKYRGLLFILLLTICLTACDLPGQGSSLNTAAIWIDAPLNGSHLPLEPYEIVMHATGAETITDFEVKVNGQFETTVTPDEARSDIMLYLAKYWWLPPDNGEYTIEVRAKNKAGAYSTVADAVVTVGEQYTLSDYTPFDPEAEFVAASDEPVEVTPEDTTCAHKVEWLNAGQAGVHVVQASQPFTVTWQLKNAGNCAWEESFKVVRVDDPITATDFAEREWPLNARVEPGQTLDFTVQVTAPIFGNGRVNLMLSDGTTNFGIGDQANAPFWFDYQVQATPTPQPTATNMPTATPQPTATDMPTLTPLPTNTDAPPAPLDTEPPDIHYTVSPNTPVNTYPTTITATATDNDRIVSIEIQLIAKEAGAESHNKTCTNVNTCVLEVDLFMGDYELRIYAKDPAGNTAFITPYIITVVLGYT